MTIHLREFVRMVWNDRCTRAVAFCGVIDKADSASMTVCPGAADCEECAAKLEKVSRAEWAAVKP